MKDQYQQHKGIEALCELVVTNNDGFGKIVTFFT